MMYQLLVILGDMPETVAILKNQELCEFLLGSIHLVYEFPLDQMACVAL